MGVQGLPHEEDASTIGDVAEEGDGEAAVVVEEAEGNVVDGLFMVDGTEGGPDAGRLVGFFGFEGYTDPDELERVGYGHDRHPYIMVG